MSVGRVDDYGMARQTVSNTIVDLNNNPVVNMYVEIQLLAPQPGAPAFEIATAKEVIEKWVTRTDNTGTWSVSLLPNTEIDPDGTVYQVQHGTPGQHSTLETFLVGTSGPYHLHDILAAAPSSIPTGSAVITFDPGDTGMSAHTVEDAIREAYTNGGGGGSAFPTYRQSASPDAPSNGETWIQISGDGGDLESTQLWRYNQPNSRWEPMTLLALNPDNNGLWAHIGADLSSQGTLNIEKWDSSGNFQNGISLAPYGLLMSSAALGNGFNSHTLAMTPSGGFCVDNQTLEGMLDLKLFRGTWVNNTTYYAGECVQDGGTTYVCTQQNDSSILTTGESNAWYPLLNTVPPVTIKNLPFAWGGGSYDPAVRQLAAPPGSLFMNNGDGVDGAGSLWFKVAEGNEQWVPLYNGKFAVQDDGTVISQGDWLITGNGDIGTTLSAPGIGLGVELGNGNAHIEVVSPDNGVAYIDLAIPNADSAARVQYNDLDVSFDIISLGHTLSITTADGLLFDGHPIVPRSFSVDLSGATIWNQGGEISTNGPNSYIQGIYQASDNSEWFTINMQGHFELTDGTAGVGGSPIYIHMSALMQSIGGSFASAMDIPYGPKGLWQGVIGGQNSVGMFYESGNSDRWDDALLSDMTGVPITTALAPGDMLAFNVSWFVRVD